MSQPLMEREISYKCYRPHGMNPVTLTDPHTRPRLLPLTDEDLYFGLKWKQSDGEKPPSDFCLQLSLALPSGDENSLVAVQWRELSVNIFHFFFGRIKGDK